jgi:hypothetical protein
MRKCRFYLFLQVGGYEHCLERRSVAGGYSAAGFFQLEKVGDGFLQSVVRFAVLGNGPDGYPDSAASQPKHFIPGGLGDYLYSEVGAIFGFLVAAIFRHSSPPAAEQSNAKDFSIFRH